MTQQEKPTYLNEAEIATVEAGPRASMTRVDHQFLRWADIQPSAPAIVVGNRVWTYGTLKDGALRVSSALRGRLTGCQTVAIHGPMSGTLVGAILGVMHAGHVFVLVDPSLPTVRQAKMLHQTAPALILATGEFPHEDVSSPVLTICDAWEADDCANSDAHFDHKNDHAYIFFTSGSTGQPKAILGSHDGLAHFVGWQSSTFEIGPHDRVANLTSMSFDVLLREVFLPLTTGASLHVPPVPTTDAFALVNWLREENISVLHAVPSLLQYWVRRCNSQGLSDLKLVFSAGEPLMPQLYRDLKKAFGEHCEVVNLYGPTETTLAKFFLRVGTDSETRKGLIPVGRPLPQTWASLKIDGRHLDATAVPIELVGEVFIHTRYSSYGYLDNEKATKAAFEGPDPSGFVRYDTGDLGYFDTQGNLVIVGRKDDQVKINGVRIEPNEIANCIMSSGFVDATHVVPTKTPSGSYQLTAYLVWKDALQPDLEASLRAHLLERLPAPMLPAVLVTLDRLPHLPNGKIDRKALPSPQMGGEFKAGSMKEARLAEIWKTVLDIPELPRKTDFFSLGGDSLLSQELCLLCEEAFGVEVTINDVFTHRDIPGIAELLTKGRRAPIPPAPEQKNYPLSAAQRRYFAMNRPKEDLTWNRLELSIQTRPDTSFEQVKQAIHTLLVRNEALRAQIVETPKGGPRQVFRNLDDLPNWSMSSPKGTSAHLRFRSFDAEGDAGHVHIEWSGTKSAGGVLRLKIPHLLVDGFSGELILNELNSLLGDEETHSNITVRYRDYTVWSLAQSDPKNSSDARTFWTSVLPPSFRGVRLQPRRKKTEAPFSGGIQPLVLQSDDLDRVSCSNKTTGASVFAYYFAAFARVLHKLCDSDRLAIVTPLTCRVHPDISNLVGCVYTHVPLVSQYVAQTGVANHARAIDKTLGQAIENHNYYIDQLLEECCIPADTPEWPISSFAFNFMTIGGHKPKLPSYGTEDRLDSRFDAQLFVRRYLDGVTAEIQYRAAVLSSEDASSLLYAWRNQLVHPDGTVYDPNLARLRERVVLDSWQSSSLRCDASTTVARRVGSTDA